MKRCLRYEYCYAEHQQLRLALQLGVQSKMIQSFSVFQFFYFLPTLAILPSVYAFASVKRNARYCR